MKSRSQAGFTLIELMVVAIIVAILAAVAIPLMSANKKRAMATEAEAGLGSVRTALRAMFAESGAYNKDLNEAAITAPVSVTNIPGVGSADLDGKYFTSPDYTLTAVGVNTYTIQAQGTGKVAGVTITLNEAGNWTRTGL
jgi:prepilin-type N-terminal cleavage/methylation domain-containing protein